MSPKRRFLLGKPLLQLLATSSNSQCRRNFTTVLRGDDLGPVQQDEYQTFRVRENGKSLPLPPLLDPLVVEKTSRWILKKDKPDPTRFTPFQKRLSVNPYAHALASPLRIDRANNIILPTSLLISLTPRPHPTTSDPWLLPVSLTTSQKHLGYPHRFLAHQYVAAHHGKKKAYQRALPLRFAEKLGRKGVEKLVWREDMASLILELLRKRAVEKLSWYFGWTGRLVPCASPSSEDIDAIDDVSSVFIFRSLRTQADDVQKETLEIVEDLDKWAVYIARGYASQLDPHQAPGVTHKPPSWYVDPLVPRLQPRVRFPPLEFKTATWRQRKVALYSLTDLLGEDKAQKLVQGSRYKDEKCFVLKQGRQTLPVDLLLMQLQTYLAQPGP